MVTWTPTSQVVSLCLLCGEQDTRMCRNNNKNEKKRLLLI
ncbi:putative signal peptide protein [Puccinia sorghi]|uniref:Putative signal peptide protein n=1 Tax=Puccinia sorghi TaxID=27349 RepID=A0A0L6UAA1_9BASI|nr:putative signal peptide protein [Puccinia sorghi]